MTPKRAAQLVAAIAAVLSAGLGTLDDDLLSRLSVSRDALEAVIQAVVALVGFLVGVHVAPAPSGAQAPPPGPSGGVYDQDAQP